MTTLFRSDGAPRSSPRASTERAADADGADGDDAATERLVGLAQLLRERGAGRRRARPPRRLRRRPARAADGRGRDGAHPAARRRWPCRPAPAASASAAWSPSPPPPSCSAARPAWRPPPRTRCPARRSTRSSAASRRPRSACRLSSAGQGRDLLAPGDRPARRGRRAWSTADSATGTPQVPAHPRVVHQPGRAGLRPADGVLRGQPRPRRPSPPCATSPPPPSGSSRRWTRTAPAGGRRPTCATPPSRCATSTPAPAGCATPAADLPALDVPAGRSWPRPRSDRAMRRVEAAQARQQPPGGRGQAGRPARGRRVDGRSATGPRAAATSTGDGTRGTVPGTAARPRRPAPARSRPCRRPRGTRADRRIPLPKLNVTTRPDAEGPGRAPTSTPATITDGLGDASRRSCPTRHRGLLP